MLSEQTVRFVEFLFRTRNKKRKKTATLNRGC